MTLSHDLSQIPLSDDGLTPSLTTVGLSLSHDWQTSL